MSWLSLHKLSESCELPPCFRYWCECGWKGLRAAGYLYVPGHPYSSPALGDTWEPVHVPCPRCDKKTRAARCGLSAEVMEERLHWAVGLAGAFEGRGGVCFPCTCGQPPPCRVVGEVELFFSSMKDVFVSDRPFVKTEAPVECYGCRVGGRLALVQEFHERDYDAAFVEDWAGYGPGRRNRLRPRRV